MARSKVTGQVVAEREGFTITMKKDGKSGKRMWLQIRQHGNVKRWRMSESLNYVRGIDLLFVEDVTASFDEMPTPEAVAGLYDNLRISKERKA